MTPRSGILRLTPAMFLTARRRRILAAIARFQRIHGLPPTRRELERLTGYSAKIVCDERSRLWELGFLDHAIARRRNYWIAGTKPALQGSGFRACARRVPRSIALGGAPMRVSRPPARA